MTKRGDTDKRRIMLRLDLLKKLSYSECRRLVVVQQKIRLSFVMFPYKRRDFGLRRELNHCQDQFFFADWIERVQVAKCQERFVPVPAGGVDDGDETQDAVGRII